MTISRRTTLKLIAILTVACVYSIIGLAGSNWPARAEGQVASKGSSSASSSGQADATRSQGRAPQANRIWGAGAGAAQAKSAGCLDCHNGIEDMHNGIINIGCTDCHGGDSSIRLGGGAAKGSAVYSDAESKAHVHPRNPEQWPNSANPRRSYTVLNQESPEFIRFVN